MRRRDEEYAKHQRRMAMERLEQRKTLAREMETSKKMQEIKAKQKLKEIEKTIAAEQKKINELIIQCERLKRDMNFLKQYGDPDLLVEKAKLYDELQETIAHLHYRHPEKYETLEEDRSFFFMFICLPPRNRCDYSVFPESDLSPGLLSSAV